MQPLRLLTWTCHSKTNRFTKWAGRGVLVRCTFDGLMGVMLNDRSSGGRGIGGRGVGGRGVGQGASVKGRWSRGVGRRRASATHVGPVARQLCNSCASCAMILGENVNDTTVSAIATADAARGSAISRDSTFAL